MIGRKSTDKGIGLSHFQVWLEFVFFDNDLLEAVKRPKPEFLTSTSWSSNSGTFTTHANGSFVKNNVDFLENDILMVFEDSAHSVITDAVLFSSTLRTELTNMTTDLLYLGWCEHDSVSSAHNRRVSKASFSQSCLFAYAVTRRAARVLTRNFELCSLLSAEEQLANMVRYGWLSARRAHEGNSSQGVEAASPSERKYGGLFRREDWHKA